MARRRRVTLAGLDRSFKGRQFTAGVILWAVRWYLMFPISYRDLKLMLQDRRVEVAHTTLFRWIQAYAPEIEKRIRPRLRQSNGSWRVDETYVKVKGRWMYLYRAVDSRGQTIDFLLSAKRDAEAAKRFFRKALNQPHTAGPRTITVDKNPAYPCAITELKADGELWRFSRLRQAKFLNNIIDKNFTPAKVERRIEQIEASIERYLLALDAADREEGEVARAKIGRLRDKITALKQQMQQFRGIKKVVEAAPDQQMSMTDPDARSMATSGKGTGIVGYNVQVAVDAKHHLIVAHEVTNVGHDRGQLSSMAEQARQATGHEVLTTLADRGYFNGAEILACEQAGIVPYVPKPLTSGAKARGRFGKQDFVYSAAADAYRCPAGQRLTWRFNTVEDGQTLRTYWANTCPTCPLKARCTTGKERRIKRWEHEAVLDAMQHRLDQQPDIMRVRRQTAEHPFGTLKAWMGSTHFLTRTLKRVSTEMSLHVLAYNVKRVIAILGVGPLMTAVRV